MFLAARRFGRLAMLGYVVIWAVLYGIATLAKLNDRGTNERKPVPLR
jgi:hypothetical protein